MPSVADVLTAIVIEDLPGPDGGGAAAGREAVMVGRREESLAADTVRCGAGAAYGSERREEAPGLRLAAGEVRHGHESRARHSGPA